MFWDDPKKVLGIRCGKPLRSNIRGFTLFFGLLKTADDWSWEEGSRRIQS